MRILVFTIIPVPSENEEYIKTISRLAECYAVSSARIAEHVNGLSSLLSQHIIIRRSHSVYALLS